MDLKVYRRNLIVATEGRAFWIVDALPVVQRCMAGLESTAPTLFRPADGSRQGGTPPTFYYWSKAQPSAPLTIEVKDGKGAIVYTTTAQPTPQASQPPPAIPAAPAAGGGRGGRGGGGGGGPGGVRGCRGVWRGGGAGPPHRAVASARWG